MAPRGTNEMKNMTRSLNLRAGDWVEVRSKEEVLRTLDTHGQLDALPFMPEMFQYCGHRFRVVKRAHKTCDPPSGLQARRMPDAVHLEGIRCDGGAHGGCQAGCLIFWKEGWLKKVDDEGKAPQPAVSRDAQQATLAQGSQKCTEQDVFAGIHRSGVPVQAEDPAYVCQSTQLYTATTALPWWDLRQYAEDVTSGNVRPSQIAVAFLFFVYHNVAQSGIGLGSAMRWAYDTFQKVRGGPPYPWRGGRIAKGARTPVAKLDLKAGELVKVRSYVEILETLDQDWRNRGMYFDGELVPFCNGEYSVLRRVETIIDEKTGKMVRLKNDAIILKDVACEARYAKCRLFCSRAIYPYWREIWLERTTGASPLGKNE
jgi:hypothetical protein